MISGAENLQDALTLAFSMEKGSNEFYIKAEEKIVDKKGKEMFKRLASFEKGHMSYIQHLYSSLSDGKKLISLAEFKEGIPAEFTEGGISIDASLAMVEDIPCVDDLDVLKMAEDREGRSYAFYQKLIRKSSDTNAKVIFEELAKEEKKHIKYMKDLAEKIS